MRLFVVLKLAAIAMSLFFATKLFYKTVFFSIPTFLKPTEESARSVSELPDVQTQPFRAYREIVTRNLFGTLKTVKKSETESEVKIKDLDNTELNLKLWGTVVGDRNETYAVIEDPSQPRGTNRQTLYRKGDSLQGATIEDILDEKVILSVNGQQELLKLEEFQNRRSSYRASRFSSRRHQRNASQRGPRKVRRSIRRSVIDKSLKDVSKLMSQAKLRPHENGLMIYGMRGRSLFRRLGLRNGDIITGVDGQRIESVDSALQFYQQLRSADKVNLSLKRRGRDYEMDYTIR